MYMCAHIYYRIFSGDPSKPKTLKPALFGFNRLALLRDVTFCISVLEKNNWWRCFHMKVLLSGEISLLKSRMCYKMSLMTFI